MHETEPAPMSVRPAPDPTPPAASPPRREHIDGLGLGVDGEEAIDRQLARIEMAGEEAAAGWKPAQHPPLSPEVRYLHVSRTIHELITDRNRSVGIFLFVASLLTGASTALLNVPKDVAPIIPIGAIQYWCLPVTFGTLAVIGAFISLLLIRARIGLIYEVAKMNALLGLDSKRVERVKPLSIFYLMHALVVLLGGASAGLAAGMLAWPSIREAGGRAGGAVGTGLLIGLGYVVVFMGAYYGTILRATTEARIASAVK